jgi:hypothetical protein
MGVADIIYILLATLVVFFEKILDAGDSIAEITLIGRQK